MEVAAVEEEAADDCNLAKNVLHQWIQTAVEKQLDAVIYEFSLVWRCPQVKAGGCRLEAFDAVRAVAPVQLHFQRMLAAG